MHVRENPLLSTPQLVVVALSAAADGPATLEDCERRLAALMERAHEHPPAPEHEISRRFRNLRRQLAAARLVEPEGEDRFALTERGRDALERHPQGMDLADLMVYPEYARHVREAAETRDRDRPREGAYDAGYAAYREGAALADNPHAEDSVDHQAWENGWFEALDEDSSAPSPP